MREMNIASILSLISGKLCNESFHELHVDLEYLVGDAVYIPQGFGRAMDEVRSYLLEWFPELNEVDLVGLNPENYRERMAAIVAQYGATRLVQPIPQDDHTFTDPLEDLKQFLIDNGRNPDDIIILGDDE